MHVQESYHDGLDPPRFRSGSLGVASLRLFLIIMKSIVTAVVVFRFLPKLYDGVYTDSGSEPPSLDLPSNNIPSQPGRSISGG
jgi:hypothetical protein